MVTYVGTRDMERAASLDTAAREIYVDLDGTILRSDIFVESACRFIKSSFLNVFSLIAVMLLRGRAASKAMLARKVRIDPATLPYESQVLAYLHMRRAEGCRLVLITAAHERYARQIAQHLGVFDDVQGSTARLNLKGHEKLSRIGAMVGELPFVYAGDSAADRPIWSAAQSAILVNAPYFDVRQAQSAGKADLVVQSRPAILKAFLRSLRLHQWAKNALLFVPLLTSHTYENPTLVAMTLIAFVAFGLCASGHYLLNDLLDLDADRAHETKRNRPLASGDLKLAWGIVGAFLLPLAGFAVSVALLPWHFTLLLVGYFVLTNIYSFYLKRHSTIDAMTLAVLYTLRVIAGAAVISVALSSWLLAFSMFVFVSLAYLKRYIEVSSLTSRTKAGGRGYSAEDSESMFALGIASATASVIVLALYVSSSEVTKYYHEPRILWLLCLLMLLWTNRIWVGARRRKIHDDPIVFAIKDRVSLFTGLLAVATVFLARYAG
jgi:4-hydroxybenzoate polyprenyltransferase